MIAILLLAAGAALFVSLVLFLFLRPRSAASDSIKKSARNGNPGRRGPAAKRGETARISNATPAPISGQDPTRLSAAEREEMLEGVKNLAESNPEKVAGLIRDWMNEDEHPPRS